MAIELTGKRWKVCQLVGILGVVVAAAWFTVLIVHDAAAPGVSVAQNAAEVSASAGWLIGVLALGVIVFLVGRIGAWWYHG